jgi:glucokinase
MSEWVVGVDLGGTKTAIGLIDPQDKIVEQRRLATLAYEGPGSIVERIGAVVDEFRTKIPSDERLTALGICAPGPLDHLTGVIINPTNLPRFTNAPMQAMISERTGLPVRLEHDAKAAALGEMVFGAGRGERNLVYIVVGTGVGAAIIMDGELLRGVKNFAGEVGHITIDRQGEQCACGSRGCVETYMSGPWLERRYARLADGAGEPVTAEHITRLAGQGEPLAGQIVREAGEALGVAVATMAMILDIELYIIGGSAARAGDLFSRPTNRAKARAHVSLGPRICIVGAVVGRRRRNPRLRLAAPRRTALNPLAFVLADELVQDLHIAFRLFGVRQVRAVSRRSPI